MTGVRNTVYNALPKLRWRILFTPITWSCLKYFNRWSRYFLKSYMLEKVRDFVLTLKLILPYFGKIIGYSNETVKLAYSVWTVLYKKRFYFVLVTNVFIPTIKMCIVLVIGIKSWKGFCWWDEANDGREVIRVSHVTKIRSIGCINVNLWNQLYVHRNIYALNVSKSPYMF